MSALERDGLTLFSLFIYQRGFVIDQGRALEIRPIPERLRQMLRPPVAEDNDEIVMIGAHILRAVDPLPHLKAHQAACDGNQF